MGKFISVSDFKGPFDIPSDVYSEDVLQEYIDENEGRFLIDLLGADLFNLFLADYVAANPTANEPTEPRFKAIYDAFHLDDNCGIIKSIGIKKMLLGFLWFDFMRDNPIKANIGGFYKNEQANGTEALFSETRLYTIENKSIDTYRNIQYYLDCWNPERYDYNLFNGQLKYFNSNI